MWFRIPGSLPDYSSGTQYLLFEIQETDFGRQLLSVQIESLFSGGVYGVPLVGVQFLGIDDFATIGGVTMFSTATSFGSWHHLFASGDFSGTGAISPPGGRSGMQFPVRLVLDGTNIAQRTGTDGTYGYLYFASPGGYPPVTAYVQSSPSTTKIGLPFISDDASSDSPDSRKREYGDFQFWNDQYIDGNNSANLAKFVTISGGHGTPVDPAVAELAFGRPALRFSGDHTHFPTNTGTGGSFTLFGTDFDFTPTPSF